MSSADIVIINWNSGKQLHQCLESIISTNYKGFELNQIIVVDNASKDNSIEGLEYLPLPLKIIRNKKNLGFAAACNQGAKNSNANYLLFLNPDTQLFEDSLKIPLNYMENAVDIGVVGIQLVDENSNVSRTCARFPTAGRFIAKMLGLDRLLPQVFSPHFMKEWDHSETRVVDQVMGAFFLVRRKVFEDLGGFDEQFFVYFEEVDFSFRANKFGWKIVYLADAQAYHKGGGTSEQIKSTRLFYSLRSRILYGYKHFGWFAATMLMLTTLIIEPFSRIVFAIARGNFKQIHETLIAFGKLWANALKLFTDQGGKKT